MLQKSARTYMPTLTYLTIGILSLALTACEKQDTKAATTEDIAKWQGELAKAQNPPPTLKAGTGANAASSSTAATGSIMKVAMPDVSTIPNDELGQSIKDGMDIVTHTYKRMPDNVGNRLNCTSCHMNNGSQPFASPWNGVPGVYPQYRARSGKVNSIEDRINSCFTRSLNGKALDVNSQEMKNIVAYMMWLSKGIPVGSSPEGRGFVKVDNNLTPNPENGKALFAQKCVTCHGTEGQGNYNADGTYTYPAIAGKDSFNDGAGMARTYTAAAFIKGNMPFGQPNTLSDQEAVDIAEYFTHLDRPVFANKAKDWPKGGAPKDARR